ncbi:MAG TPA: gas vesicle protein [Bacillota bacterium]|nr:gas vesicle protein [Bacillota bacterium]
MSEESLLERITILEVLDHILDKGVVISGNIVISVADVDLIYLGLQLVLASVDTLAPKGSRSWSDGLSLLYY